jgi:hypothetical protein
VGTYQHHNRGRLKPPVNEVKEVGRDW